MKWMRAMLITMTAMGGPLPDTQAAVPPVEAFGRLPALTRADLSPDGSRALSIASVDGQPIVAVMDVDVPNARWRPILKGDSQDFRVSWCRFKTRDRILCGFRGIDHGDHGEPVIVTRLIGLNADGGDVKVLMRRAHRGGGGQFQDRIVDMIWDDPDHVLVQMDEDVDGYPSVMRVNVRTGTPRVHTAKRQPIRNFFADDRGRVRLGVGVSGRYIAWLMRADDGEPWHELERYRPFQEEGDLFVGFGDEPDQVYVERLHDGRKALWLIDVTDQGNPKLIYSHPSVDIDGPVVWNGRLVGVAYEAERPEIYWLDDDARALHAQLKRLYPGTFPDVVAQSRDGRRMLVDVRADQQPSIYVLVDRRSGTAKTVALSYPALKPDALAAMKSVTYLARDGTTIPGFLTVPNGVPAINLPLVVMPHGGPLTRDRWGFDYLQQFLVSRGYAVLQMDFRGSSGYGATWTAAAHQDWGGLSYDDVIDGVRWAVDRKIADPTRIAAVGASYGGYIALLGAARNADLFRCAISIAGVTDLRRMLDFTGHFVNAQIAREQIGTDGDELRANSPRRLVDDILVPVQIFHGLADAEVPVTQGRLMRDALKRAGKPHEYIEFADETHQIDHEKNRIDMLRRIEAFLARHVPPGPTTAPAP